MRYILSILFLLAPGVQAKVTVEKPVNKDFYERALLVLDALEEQSDSQNEGNLFGDVADENNGDLSEDIEMANRPLLMEGLRFRVCGRLSVHMDNILKRKNVGRFTKRKVLISDIATLAKCDEL